MAAPTTEPEDIQSTDIQPLPLGHRGVAKNIPIEKLIDLRVNKKLSYPQIAKIAGCTHQNVMRRLKTEGIITLQEYKENRADVFAAMQGRIINSITDENIKKASLYQKVGVIGLLYDKERLERGESTENIHVITQAISDLQARKWGRAPQVEKKKRGRPKKAE